MAEPLTHLKERFKDDWLIGIDSQAFAELADQRLQELREATNSGTPATLLLAEVDPLKFLAGFVAACAVECPVILGSPHWVEAEWQQVLNLTQPDLIFGNPYPLSSCQDLSEWVNREKQCDRPPKGWIMIPTGGSSGQIRFAIHTWTTLMASVQGFRQYFQLNRANSCCVLPLYHVSGLMQFLRSFTSGGKFAVLPFKDLETREQAFDPSEFFLSLVPTQLQRSLQNPNLAQWLAKFQTVLLGGAPPWAELLDWARQQQIRLAPTYGMTETASQIVTLKPEFFLKGHSSCGTVLPHAHVTIRDAAGQVLGPHQVGKITIQSDSLAIGYYPDRLINPTYFQPDDLGFWDAQGELNLVGRDSHKIITGGENVFPTEVEDAIQATGLVVDVGVIGVGDRLWGEAIAAVYVPQNPEVSIPTLQSALQSKLSKFKQPKHWIEVQSLPRNLQGKINREQLKQIAETKIVQCDRPAVFPTDLTIG